MTLEAAVTAPALTRPRMRGRLHQVAFFVAIPAGVVLVAAGPTASTRVAALVYWITMLAQFGVSAAYHRGVWDDRSYERWKTLDHSTIFLLIAGTYTPVCVLVLTGPWEVAVLVAVWAGAAAGVATKLYRNDLHLISGVMYAVLGWAAVMLLPAIVGRLPLASVILIVAGGVVYSCGAFVLATNRPDPFPLTFGYHEVWHTATVLGAACMYTATLVAYLSV